MRKIFLLIAATLVLSAFPGCASYCCNNSCDPCGSTCQPLSGQVGNCCDQWMDGTDACVDGLCQQNSLVKGLLRESCRSSQKTLKQLYSNKCSSGCGVTPCGGCMECQQYGPPPVPCGCGGKCKSSCPSYNLKLPKWKTCWKPKLSCPWKKKSCICGATTGSCSCGASQGNCSQGNCGTGHFDHPADLDHSAGSGDHSTGYSYLGEGESLGMSPQGNGPVMEGPGNYFSPQSQPNGMPVAGPQMGVPPLAPPALMPEPMQEMPMQGAMVPPSGMEPTQQLPPPLPEGSPRGLQWRAVSSYRESFPAPPAADEQNYFPMKTPSRVVTPNAEGAENFQTPLIIDSK